MQHLQKYNFHSGNSYFLFQVKYIQAKLIAYEDKSVVALTNILKGNILDTISLSKNKIPPILYKACIRIFIIHLLKMNTNYFNY